MLESVQLSDILFIDIETVPLHPTFEALNAVEQDLFAQKTAYQRQAGQHRPEDFYERAGIWAEFGKIICISVGFFTVIDRQEQFRVKSFYGEEQVLLSAFSDLLNTHFSEKRHLLCAHNGKEFDFPYIARRMVILGLPLPEKLNLFGKKPWEVAHLDTMELWKFGDYKHYTSLKLLTHILGIPSPKEDIDGSQVAAVYYRDQDLKRIVAYCERDVVAIAQIVLKYKHKPLLKDEQISVVI
ncbi:MAG: 3'-5' exonuclease [Flavobacteriia bacterium]|nr:MAG: 3'-5' exonuclease [Flavobacteriia bacterium]